MNDPRCDPAEPDYHADRLQMDQQLDDLVAEIVSQIDLNTVPTPFTEAWWEWVNGLMKPYEGRIAEVVLQAVEAHAKFKYPQGESDECS